MLLKAIAQKLIPGIPQETRVAILQQTDAEEASADLGASYAAGPSGSGRTVLEEIIERATSKDELKKEISILNEGLDGEGGVKAGRAVRLVRYERMQKRWFELDKMARLRSGTRGMAARKELLAFEKELAEFKML